MASFMPDLAYYTFFGSAIKQKNEPGYGRVSIQGVSRQNSPGGGRLHSLFRAASTVSCRRASASAPAHIPAHAGSYFFYCITVSFRCSFVSPDMGGSPFKGSPVKTAPAAAVCIAFSKVASTVSCRRALASAPAHIPARAGLYPVPLCTDNLVSPDMGGNTFKRMRSKQSRRRPPA